MINLMLNLHRVTLQKWRRNISVYYMQNILSNSKTDKRKDDFMYKKKEKKPTKIIVVPHFIGTEKDTKIFKKIVEEKVQKKLRAIPHKPLKIRK